MARTAAAFGECEWVIPSLADENVVSMFGRNTNRFGPMFR